MEIMKNKSRKSASSRYTIAGLIVALLACISTGVLLAAKGVIALGLYTIQFPERLNNALWISIGMVVLGIAAYAILEPGKFQRFITGRQARYGGNTLIASVAFVAIIVVANVLAYQNPTPLADLTEDQANTLAPELEAALKSLPDNVHATGFFSAISTDSAQELLDRIKSESNGKFDYEFVDPDRDPLRARENNITGDGKILLEMSGRKEIAASASESEIFEALLRLINPEERVIYFLIGHGERDTLQFNQESGSMTRAREILESKNYTVNTLNLVAENKIPEDADLIIIAGPIQPITDVEGELLRSYLTDGGSLLVMEDPLIVTDFGDQNDPLAGLLLEDWGISINNDIVIDLDSPDPSVSAAASYDGSHAITRNMNNLITYFPLTRSLTIVNAVENVRANLLVQTTARSWGETNPADPNVAFDDTLDIPGPMTLSIAAENSASTARVVVFGSSQFAVDQNFDQYGNGDLFANSVDWAAQQESLIELTPKQPVTRSFTPASQGRILLLMFVVAILMPGIFIVLGVMTWLQRRKQG
jgi:ABC-type uncharacterized transport system involved in gliding motility auxiliary subunit